ncbi:hypothetical protein SAMN02800694_1937 [Luteibacter sp. UNCMF331Sha3.1]|uniref:DUF2066 domain-containing protein n=1 Tax=Luteibacter sp. UNCMF331Sha3.1 TaxID=1502760 RepID=UPI0008D83E64|nr:DUF2066 domain-containing protein [Luteibacter sp. UNCMF331Sha3.1]SEM86394.1 hypothetical protein SAMN02800694_1937 [Luteibacter sp. UNCMF331Sha3.1]
MRPARLIASLLFLVMASFGVAVAQTSIYTVTVPVADTSAAVRDQAFATGLTQVLARASNGADPRGKPGFADAMKQPGGLVQQYQYARTNGANGAPLSLDIVFDPGAIRRVLAVGDAAVAAPKAPVLVVARDASGRLLGQQDLAPLAQMADARGYAIVVPKDGSNPDVNALATGDAAAVATVARQYNTGVVLVGRIGDGQTDWTLVSAGRTSSWQDSGEARAALLTNGANAMADKLDRQFAATQGGSASGRIWVSGLRSAHDYAGLLATFQNDPSVKTVAPVGATADGVLLAVSATAPLARLVAGYASGGHILAADGHDGADLAVRWVP